MGPASSQELDKFAVRHDTECTIALGNPFNNVGPRHSAKQFCGKCTGETHIPDFNIRMSAMRVRDGFLALTSKRLEN